MSGYAVDIARLEALTPGELYAILKLRIDVFVVEQNCPYPELDGKDFDALHLRLIADGAVMAYARVFPPGADGAESRIGRVVVSPDHRGRKLGDAVMREAIAACGRIAPDTAIAISAQAHLQRFYGSLGFVAVSAEYLEDGIPHVDMIRQKAEETAS
ncbi:GNAT family N-acetyltransferase [Martelella endophytica]|uniref:Acyltransferase n=1 Tax=Martelella endophytica TaxID=1486262 RepID=A0A0D5LSD9_MAREN|nr:GNAT family N-acetyltransferase [Martelella endophytica]AJY46996.1 acyltransferase [Martelella endophytica]